MSVQFKDKSGSSDAVIQTLKWIRKQGFKPVPLRKQSKAALDEKYVDLNYSPSDDLWATRDLGIGVVTGPKHSGPLDVDIDCDEAGFFAKRFLPATSAVFGRQSKRSSHYLYRGDTEAFPKRAFVDPLSKSTIIELRGDGGHQTVFPGSIHEDTGEVIEWEDKAFPEVSRVVADDLDRAVKKIAIAVLVTRHMWSEGQRNEICKHLSGLLFYMEWTEAEVKELVSAVMEYSGDTDKTRLRTVGITFRKGETGGKVTGAATLREFLGDGVIVDRILQWVGNEAASVLQEYNERFATVIVKGKFRIAETTPLKRGEPPEFFRRDDFMNYMEPDTFNVLDDKGKPKQIPKAVYWLKNSRRRSYRAIEFIPGVEDATPYLNLWTGWGVEPDKTKSCSAWLDLLFYVICGGDDPTFTWMLNWFAHIVREPLNKFPTAPVLVGPQGAGKSLMTSYFGRILGPSYNVVTKDDHIVGKFNKHMASTLLLHSEEALYGGDKKHAGIIRELITGDKQQVEMKGVDVIQIPSYVRLLLTTNETWAAPTAADERRFTVIDMEGRSVKTDLAFAVDKELKETGGPSGLFYYLMNNFDYDPMLAKKNLKNEALATLKRINFNPIAAWWYETLMNGQLLPDYMAWAQRPESDEWPEVISSAALHLSLQLSMRNKNQRFVPDLTVFALELNKMLGIKLNRIQKYFTNPMSDEAPREVRLLPNKQYTITNMPSLKECRQSFNWFMKQDITWPSEDVADKPIHLKF